ncbi:hypothetical protein EN828_20190 [Mesorhizobium sp. M2D.F.Ca.ET.185.01.1.1]|uniref:hypothetical protein n=1 Tax=unclassified Mesorhizobium TaxID=325217 RepID=UPI000FCC60F8|nr:MULTISPECIES: hypothetical protein [unclassified Mesorhizobium]TGP49763.1 hypothetical protein EN873_27910 [bacterium M00.F.Ca.ET.230.01.1.1]TGP78890.1 hypothetical protein EN870_15545 [bacterium M00.F.Ca.ET.227.01.1.1]TGP89582.1 hypothetical protein EN864_20800 [bacterium M00.F.Ca.ET.221.01.1.1]TGP94950.1 hypothetical protein EN865_16670 [bacterium M00.F.Ca.ET.222.01.1.1]TGT71110.1 hypothetical protein EN802_19445 [bacterium M00.F.Ca.ET.159.01.1.1]TGT82953.1 hypothetical protein EN800_176
MKIATKQGKLTRLTEPQLITNEIILRILQIALIEIRAADSLDKARMLADAFHNAPVMIASGREPQETWARILDTASRLEIETYVASLLGHVRS